MTAAFTSGPLTYDDYALIPYDGHVHELIDGELYGNASPVSFHQTVSRRLQHRLMLQLEDPGFGFVFNAPTDVILSHKNVLVPDLALISAARKAIISARGIEGPPDIAVEILSPSNRRHDEVRKRAIYERYRVPEYWIVDPAAFTLQILRLHGDVFHPHAALTREDTLTSLSFEGRIEVPLAPIFAPL